MNEKRMQPGDRSGSSFAEFQMASSAKAWNERFGIPEQAKPKQEEPHSDAAPTPVVEVRRPKAIISPYL